MTTEVVITNNQSISEVVFQDKMFSIYGTFENPLFLAKDVAEWIDYCKNPNGSYKITMMLKNVDEDEKLKRTIYVSGQRREVWFVTEKGLKILLANSRNLKAKQLLQSMEESFVFKNVPKEIKFHSLLEESVETIKKEFPERSTAEKNIFLDLQTQYRFGYYKVDFFFPGANLVVEYDEKHHKQQEEEDLKREESINSKTGAHFIRVVEGNELQGIVEITTYLTKKFLSNGGER